ncbi:hypothetical protein [Alkalicoccus halolimnae]|uniref:Uncharacterized protein n=1 Tax=Alkalicoccus halolimnae TaxID=1667239 RepID=A0A5C7F159_9BACI|nr:hypothetical protein [Alkalicoccus halolimnae]TXF83275.1 hypothetical protein FTX54_12910 [Alkalicoccus halolimnae]
MEIIFKKSTSSEDQETIRQLSGFYGGIAAFKTPYKLVLTPKRDFAEKQLMDTLQSQNFLIEKVVKSEYLNLPVKGE